MVKIYFKNLDPSELAREIVWDKLNEVAYRFPGFKSWKIEVTLSVEHSFRQNHPDIFVAEFVGKGRGNKNFALEKRANNMYEAVEALGRGLKEHFNGIAS